MKKCAVVGVLTILVLAINVFAFAGTFIKPSTWDNPDDDHYNTYLEDQDLLCHKEGGVIDESCDDATGYTPEGYVKRDCGYGGHCSTDNIYHAAIDYDYPHHPHDPTDYVNEQRKSVNLRQGKGINLDYHEDYDNVVASNDGEVVFASDDINKTHKYGKVIIIKHENLIGCNRYGGDEPTCPNGVIYTKYAHMSKLVVSVGEMVSRGQKIGEIGGTGGWIHHLHFEFLTNTGPDNDELRSPYCAGNTYGYVSTVAKMKTCGYRDPADFLGKVGVSCGNSSALAPLDLCGAYTCDIDYQTFSDGDVVGWYPQGYCTSATDWFTLVDAGNGEYQLGERLSWNEVCICR